jgi:hypothetical protein
MKHGLSVESAVAECFLYLVVLVESSMATKLTLELQVVSESAKAVEKKLKCLNLFKNGKNSQNYRPNHWNFLGMGFDFIDSFSKALLLEPSLLLKG